MLRTAVEWSVPPLVMLRGRESHEWSTLDRTLAVAYTLSQDLLCPGCGHPKSESYNPDSEGWYDVKDANCNGCAALARDGDIHKEHQPERKVWVRDERPPEVKLKPWTPD